MSLYRKYRPQNFNSFVGQEHAKTTLKNAIKNNQLTHAYLFSGPRGTGKTSMARIIAKALNCSDLKDNTGPCDICENCKSILSSRMVDLIEIDAASNRGIDEIRELREKIQFSPTQGKVKVYIIDEVHMLTKEAFNALLKTLEEPPEHAYFILATTEAHKIPETIISRCQQFTFRRISNENIVARLAHIAKEEGIEAEDNALKLIAKTSNGGLRDAIGLLEQMNTEGKITHEKTAEQLGLTGNIIIEEFFTSLTENSAGKAIDIINKVNNQGYSLNQFCSEFLGYLREQMLLGVNAGKQVGGIIEYIETFSSAKQQINQALTPQLPLEIAAIKACDYNLKPPCHPENAERSPSNLQNRTDSDPDTQPQTPNSQLPTLTTIQKNWKLIINNIETPHIKMALMDAEPSQITDKTLVLIFRSHTFKEKIEDNINQEEVQRSFEKVLNTRLNIDFQIKKVTLQPISQEQESNKTEPKNETAGLAEKVFANT